MLYSYELWLTVIKSFIHNSFRQSANIGWACFVAGPLLGAADTEVGEWHKTVTLLELPAQQENQRLHLSITSDT